MAASVGFELLWADVPNDRTRWVELWGLWPGREVFAHPAYAKLFCAEGDRSLCAAWSGPRGGVLFPLLMRPLAREPWAGTSTGRFDLTSPYGYGGPFCWGEADGPAFWEAFQSWAAGAGALTCFARLGLFPDQLLPFCGAVEENAPNVVRTLYLSPEELWMEYEHKVRKNVNRARARGVVVERDETGKRLGEFLSIYHGTMERRGAAGGYFFPPEFFEAILEGLPGQFVFFHALLGGRMVSTELVLASECHLYSFLGGTLEQAFDARPNDLLKHEVISWGTARGKESFVLGGGYGGPDGIFRYKLSFAPHGEVPFRTGQIIFDRDAYDGLVAVRRSWETEQGREWQPRPTFFPSYRA